LGQRVGDVGGARAAGELVRDRAEPRLLALRPAGLDEPGVVRPGGEDERGRHRTPTSSPTRWLTTRLEPPGGIETPYRQSAASIVRFWCDTITSCASSRNSCTRSRKRCRLTSSSAASTSSIR